jgi:hypothetical protein
MEYLMLRGIFMPARATKEQVGFYVELFKKVRETPEWKTLMNNGAFNTTFIRARRHHRRAAGLGGANGVAILLPLTFSMSPTSAIIMLSCIYWGALFGGAITVDPVQHPGRAVVGRDHLRRLSDGAAGQGRRGADRGVHLVVRRRAVRRHHDHLPGAAGRELRAALRAAEFFAVYFLTFCSFVGMGKEPPFKTIAR